MMKKMSTMVLNFALLANISGLLLITMSNHYIMMFVGLELMTFSFITIMSPTSPRQVESSVKYFIIQSSASIILLLSLIFPSTQISVIFHTTLIMSLLVKLAAAPFHSWFPEVTQGMKWKPATLILTWQKLGALIILSRTLTIENKTIMTATAITSAVVGAVSGLNQVQTRKIMAYSSISHMGWTLLLFTINQQIAMTYFVIYAIITVSIMTTMEYHNSSHLSKMHMDSFLSPWTVAMTLSLILSLGGLPPLGGFLNKVMAFKEMINNNLIVITLIMILSSLMSLFFYLRIAYSTTLTSSSQHTLSMMTTRTKKMTTNSTHKTPPFTMMITLSHIIPILGLLITPTMIISLMSMTS
uniref:NADH-ubiquinone oxidoreductase chain 2 n=1 Tax=Xenoturbella monstrosa TaxID=1755483 RepID=A0A0U2KUJ4_9BILA|nr:NADH dehydrogenase subunit 2 [Xenoturbella monstrosa]ALS20078.1 NADH dehydrogenase subunit 2 [Xenoturbella monstrosa]